MPLYRALAPGYLDGTHGYIAEGEIFEYEGTPGKWMELYVEQPTLYRGQQAPAALDMNPLQSDIQQSGINQVIAAQAAQDGITPPVPDASTPAAVTPAAPISGDSTKPTPVGEGEALAQTTFNPLQVI